MQDNNQINKDLRNQIIKELHGLPFKSYAKVIDNLSEKFPNVNKEALKSLHKQYANANKTPAYGYARKKKLKPYFLNIFSSSPNCYFHDIFHNGSKNNNQYPKYYHIFLGMNTRWAKAYPVNDLSANTAYNTLKHFITTYKPYKLTSDEGSAFQTTKISQLCKDYHVERSLINAKANNHAGLGTIDRFCRTIRAMFKKHIQAEKDYIDDTNNKTPFIPVHEMNRLIDEYNDTKNYALGQKTPNQMNDNFDLEKDYIIKHLIKKDEIENTPGFRLQPGSYVRYHPGEENQLFAKGDKSWSTGLYKVVKHVGNKTVIQGKDNTTKAFSRAQLLPTELNEFNKEGSSNWEEKKKGRPKKNKYNKVIPKNKSTTNMITRNKAKEQPKEIVIEPPTATMRTRTQRGEIEKKSYDYNRHYNKRKILNEKEWLNSNRRK